MDSSRAERAGKRPGDRVGAVSHSEGDTIMIFGYGVYQGYQVPDPKLGVQIFGVPMENENPCILLDSGKLVYGCECWWGSEARVKEMVGNKKVIVLDIEEQRNKYREPKHPDLEPDSL